MHDCVFDKALIKLIAFSGKINLLHCIPTKLQLIKQIYHT